MGGSINEFTPWSHYGDHRIGGIRLILEVIAFTVILKIKIPDFLSGICIIFIQPLPSRRLTWW